MSGGQQRQAQNARGITGAGDALVGGDLPDAAILAPGQPSVPVVGPDQGVDQRDVRLRIAVGTYSHVRMDEACVSLQLYWARQVIQTTTATGTAPIMAHIEKGVTFPRNPLLYMVGRIGFEPMTNGLKIHCSTD